MIKSAQNKNEHFPQLQFHRKNVESEFDDVDQYDVAICLFGLHWMNDLEHTATAIHKSLRTDGILLSLTPIEIKDLFDFRTSFVNTSRWSTAF
jgi:SAM-dependent methyltransferase